MGNCLLCVCGRRYTSRQGLAAHLDIHRPVFPGWKEIGRTLEAVRRPCEQGCGADAEVYAIDPAPDGWGGHYCRSCAAALRFQIVVVYDKEGTT